MGRISFSEILLILGITLFLFWGSFFGKKTRD